MKEAKPIAALFDALSVTRYSPLANTHPPSFQSTALNPIYSILLLPVELNSCVITRSGWILDTEESLFLYEMITDGP